MIFEGLFQPKLFYDARKLYLQMAILRLRKANFIKFEFKSNLPSWIPWYKSIYFMSCEPILLVFGEDPSLSLVKLSSHLSFNFLGWVYTYIHKENVEKHIHGHISKQKYLMLLPLQEKL